MGPEEFLFLFSLDRAGEAGRALVVRPGLGGARGQRPARDRGQPRVQQRERGEGALGRGGGGQRDQEQETGDLHGAGAATGRYPASQTFF